MSHQSDDPGNSGENGEPPDSRSCGEAEFLAASPTDTDTSLPAIVGQHRILRKPGEGGMGVVFLAEQRSC